MSTKNRVVQVFHFLRLQSITVPHLIMSNAIIIVCIIVRARCSYTGAGNASSALLHGYPSAQPRTSAGFCARNARRNIPPIAISLPLSAGPRRRGGGGRWLLRACCARGGPAQRRHGSGGTVRARPEAGTCGAPCAAWEQVRAGRDALRTGSDGRPGASGPASQRGLRCCATLGGAAIRCAGLGANWQSGRLCTGRALGSEQCEKCGCLHNTH